MKNLNSIDSTWVVETELSKSGKFLVGKKFLGYLKDG